MKIEVLGSGCAKCGMVEAAVREAAAGAGIAAEIVKVTDIGTILAYNVLMLPAIVVDGRVRMSGRVPTADEVKALLAPG